MDLTVWITLPLIAAAIGWFTNFVAVRMIFRPHRRINILGFGLQGVLPKRKAEFAENIGATVSEHLIDSQDIVVMLDDPKVQEKLKGVVAKRIDDFIQNKLIGSNPMLGAFLKGPFVDSMKANLIAEVGVMFGDGVALLGDHLDENLDLKKIVEDKILEFDMHKLEAIALRVASRELKTIEYLGAVLGFCVGLMQLLVLKFAG